MPGWGDGSWAFHGDDGKLFLERGQGVRYGDTYGTADVVGCGADSQKNELFFTKNGEYLGSAGSVPKGRLFATVGIGCEGVHFSINFGLEEFRYSL
ncbi:hypothetical protein K469DRAFT_713521 [Zopfia rhizophila CBS 207.26]|uniref:B30.2/SPRY domain-containing protein n=1 Tax=Zopfia rhizophila CBS 207.26 TaxID=1314779 RepID=A0A6A6DR17_9PEZI|nr:hypothetical protein K469DRAFT_713521 [Zopfia rhizophila CBS 207.26]